MKKFEIPEIKVSAFDAEDIITASGLTPAPEKTYDGGANSNLYMSDYSSEHEANAVTIPNPFN